MHAKMTMLIGLVPFALFALPAFATQDFITRDAYEVLRKSGVANDVTKTVVSSPFLEESLDSYAKNKLGGVIPCCETSFGGTCCTPGCSCVWPVCTGNSLEEIKTSNFNLEETLVSYPKSKLGGVIPCGKTCFGGTCYTHGCTCIWPVLTYH